MRLSGYLLILLFQCVFLSISYAQVSLTRVKVTPEISMKIPVSFAEMSAAEINGKYVSHRRPIAMFTGEAGEIDLGINKNSSAWVGNDLDIVKSFYKANIQNLFTEVDFHKEGSVQIGGREFAVFEFTSKVTDDENVYGGLNKAVSKYTYIMYTIHEDGILLFNFTCSARLRAKWQPYVQEIMESVRVK